MSKIEMLELIIEIICFIITSPLILFGFVMKLIMKAVSVGYDLAEKIVGV